MKKLLTVLMMCFAVFAVNAQSFLLQESFESGIPAGWTVIDNDGDGYGWDADYWTNLSTYGHTGPGTVASASYDNTAGELTPDNWLITPALNIPAAAAMPTLSLWARDRGYSEPLEILVSTTGTTVADFTADPVFSQLISGDAYAQYTVDLSAYANQTIYIAFVHRNCTDNFWLILDDIEVSYADLNVAAAPSNFTVTPDANYDLNASLSWTNPSLTVGGTALTSITSIELYRDNTLLNSFANPTVGGAMTYTDNVSAAGLYNYRVYAVTAEGDGVSATQSATIGHLCGFTLEMSDAYGDGWNGAAIEIYDATNNLFGTYTVDALTQNEVVMLPIGEYTFSWVSGDWDGECSFTLTDPFGYLIYTGGAPSAAGVFATFNNTCEPLPTSITATPDTLALFLAIVGSTSSVQTISFNAWMLNEDLTVSADTSFEVSADGTNFATTATIPYVADDVTLGSVYVRFAPTAAGTQTGEITLSSSGVSAIVAVEGNAVVCEAVTEFPYNCGFEPNSEQVLCWETVDVDNNGEGNGGQISFMAYSEANPGCAVYFYDDSLAANDWLISPEFVLSDNMYAAFDYLVANSTYPETFSVYVIPEGETYATATQVLAPMAVTNTAWETQRIALGAYNGQTVRVAIHVESAADQHYIAFDNFTVDAAEVDLVATPNTLTFNAIAGSATQAQTVQVSSWSLTENIAVTTNAPFEVSADGNAFATTATLNYAADDYTDVTLYVRYNPAEVGSDNGVVTLISTGDTATITVNGTAIDCSQAATLPFTEDFEDELSACWQNIDADGDGRTWFNALDLGLEAFNGDGAYVSASYDNSYGVLTPENWLISPAIAIPEEGAVISWYVAAQDADYPAEYYQVMVSTGNSVSDFSTILFNEELSSGDWEERTANIEGFNGQNVYIAFVHMNSSDNYMMKIDDINITAGTVGIEENEASSVRVFPNPATNMVNVEAQGFAQYQLVNMLGQTVESNNLVNGNAQINVANLSNGVYFVRLINGNTVETVKVIKK